MIEKHNHWMDLNRLRAKTPDWKKEYDYQDADCVVEYYDDVEHKGVRFRGITARATYKDEQIVSVAQAWKHEDTDYIFYLGGAKGYPDQEDAIQLAKDRVEDGVDEYLETEQDIDSAGTRVFKGGSDD